MTTKWPRELELAQRTDRPGIAWDAQRIVEFTERLKPETIESLAEVASQLVASASVDKLHHDLDELVTVEGLDEEGHALLLCLACSVALERQPSTEAWGEIQKIVSSHNAIWLLGPALQARARHDENVRDAFLALAREVFGLRDAYVHAPDARSRAVGRLAASDYWPRVNNKLEDLWLGLRWSDSLFYQLDFPLFDVLAVFSPDEFVKLLSEAKNPNLVQSALVERGGSFFNPVFENWAKLAAGSPVAFSATGKWNGSMLLPILLFSARSELFQAAAVTYRLKNRHDADVEMPNLDQLIGAVVDVLARRDDAEALFIRWSAWLMRHLLDSVEAKRSEHGSTEYIDCKLLEAISEHLKGRLPQLEAPSDTGEWEHWSRICALSLHASYGAFDVPQPDAFLQEWTLTPEDWGTARGQILRAHASAFTLKRGELPGLEAHLLAYPLVQKSDSGRGWVEVWQEVQTLRDIVEFGDYGGGNEAIGGPHEASGLLLLLFRIGLAGLDQLRGAIGGDSIRAHRVVAYHTSLAEAVLEMVEIDNTIHRTEWQTLMMHVVARRFLWEKEGDANDDLGTAVFAASDEPQFATCLSDARRNPVELFQILATLLANNAEERRILLALKEASIDLMETIGIAKRLNKIDPRRYPVDDRLLRQLENLGRSGS